MSQNITLSKQEIYDFTQSYKGDLSTVETKEIALKAMALVIIYPEQVLVDIDKAIDEAEKNYPQAFYGNGRNLLGAIKDSHGFKSFIGYLSGAQAKGLLTYENKLTWVRELLPSIGGSEDNPGLFFQDSVYDLINTLLTKTDSKTLYIPFESRFRNTLMLGQSRDVFVEGLINSSIPYLFDLILGNVHYQQGNAATNPAFIENGKLQKFDAGFVADPWGARGFEKELKKDTRFAIHSNNYDHYLMQHTMQQVDGLLIVAVPSGMTTSSVASEISMREWLIQQKHLKAVVSLPIGAISNASINSALLVFDMCQQYNEVDFIALKNSEFVQRKAREIGLVEVEQLAELILSDAKNKNKVTVSHVDIAKQGYALDPDRYVVDDDTQQALDVLNGYSIVPLSKLVDIIRPVAMSKLKQEGQELVHEIQSGDLPEYGFIDAVSKHTNISEDVLAECESYFVKANDIIITVRGSVGKVGIVSQNLLDHYQGRVIAGQTNMVLRIKANSGISSPALLMQLRSDFGQSRLRLLSAGAVIAGVSLKDLKDFPIALLSPEKQQISTKNLLVQQAVKQEIAQKQQQMHQLDNDIWV